MTQATIPVEQARDVLEKLKINKSQDLDEVHPHFLREIPKEIAEPLNILRKSLESKICCVMEWTSQ